MWEVFSLPAVQQSVGTLGSLFGTREKLRSVRAHKCKDVQEGSSDEAAFSSYLIKASLNSTVFPLSILIIMAF